MLVVKVVMKMVVIKMVAKMVATVARVTCLTVPLMYCLGAGGARSARPGAGVALSVCSWGGGAQHHHHTTHQQTPPQWSTPSPQHYLCCHFRDGSEQHALVQSLKLGKN